MSSGNKLQRQKKGPGSLRKRKAKRTHLGVGERERCGCAPERVLRGKNGMGKGVGFL